MHYSRESLTSICHREEARRDVSRETSRLFVMSGITHLNDDDALVLVGAIYKQALDDIAGRDYATPYQMMQAKEFIRDNPYNLPDAVINEIEKEARKYAN